MTPSLRIPLLKDLDNLDLDTALEQQGARFDIAHVNWPSEYPYAPVCAGKIARTEESLVVDWRVSGLDLRVQNLADGGRIWEDSCCEIFLSVPGSWEYFNFEINAGGHLLAAHGPSREGREKIATDDIMRFASVEGPIEQAGGIWNWRVTLLIPFEVLGLDPDDLPSELLANLYKCGDLTAHPHFLSWAPINTPTPDFHRPEFFGKLLLK